MLSISLSRILSCFYHSVAFEIFFSHLSQGELLILLNYLFLSPISDDFLTLFIIYLFIYVFIYVFIYLFI